MPKQSSLQALQRVSSSVSRHRLPEHSAEGRLKHDRHACRAVRDSDAAQRTKSHQGNLNAAIAALAIPALGTELIDPLLSACDTAFVGRLDAEQLAGVGLASSVFTYTFLFFNFLSTASAPLIAQALARCGQ